MTGNNIKPDPKKLRDLYASNPAARAIFDEFARRERNRNESKVDNLLYVKVENRPITRGEIIRFFQDLQKVGCGAFVVGRKGHPSRFEWTVGLPAVGRAAAGEPVPLEAITEEERKLEQLPEGELETYTFPLRPNLKIELELPIDLSTAEASRLADFIRALPFDRKSAGEE